MKNIALALTLSFGCVFVCFSNTSLDSLYKKAYNTDDVKALTDLVPVFIELSNSDESAYLYKLYFLIGYKASEQKENALAFSYYQKSFELAQKIEDFDRQRSVMVNISFLYYSVDDFFHAKKFTLRAIGYAEKANQRDRVAAYFFDLGTYSRRQGKIDSAVYYLEEAYKQELALGNPERQAIALNELGLCAYDVDDFEQASTYYDMAINASDTSNHIKYMVYANQGLIELKKENLSKSKELLNKSIAAARLWNKNENILIPQLNLLGEIYMESQQYDSALSIFTKALSLNDYNGLNGADTKELSLTMRFLYEIQAILGQKYLLTDLGVYDQYGTFLRWQMQNQNELEKLNARMSLQMANERIKNEKKMAIIKKKLSWLSVFVLIFSVVACLIIWLSRKKKKEMLLKKIEQFDKEFEDKYSSTS